MTEALWRLADANLATTWARVGRAGGVAVSQIGPLRLVATGIPLAFFNGAFLTAPTRDPEESIRSAVGFMAGHGVPWLLWVRPGLDDALLTAGRRAGLRDAGGPPAMVLEPIPPIPPPPTGLEITVVSDGTGVEAHCDVAARGFDLPVDIMRRLVNERTLSDPDFGAVLGMLDGEPVATAVVSVTGRTAGVYNVATPPEHRRRGFGAALTWAAIAEGVRRGCDHSVLQASAAGRPVYEAMGFGHLGDYAQLEGPAQ